MMTAAQYSNSNVFALIEKEQSKDLYIHSPFKAFKSLSSKKKGKFFEHLYADYVSGKGFKVEKPDNSDHDRKVNGRKKEIKGSFLWGAGTHFRWQQIRPGQDYDDVVFVSVYPDHVEFHEADKVTVAANLVIQDENGFWIHNQHGGKRVNSGTFFLDGIPSRVKWLKAV